KYLVSDTDFFTGLRPFNDAIYGSDYLKFYNALLSNEKLIEAAEKYGYTLQFIPHPQMVSAMPAFKFSDKVKVLDASMSYRDIYAQSDLMVTDYSSAIFDFAYLRKPIIYAQFDRDDFYGGGHSYENPCFDDERDGFGEVEYDLDSTINRIIEYMENGCKLKDKYRERIDNFFAFNDKNSCERIYNKITEMDK
ncbi:MAG: CDP-glycerol glycerophosphotransferase family protein, partial [Acutalibacteraceae bacterium]